MMVQQELLQHKEESWNQEKIQGLKDFSQQLELTKIVAQKHVEDLCSEFEAERGVAKNAAKVLQNQVQQLLDQAMGDKEQWKIDAMKWESRTRAMNQEMDLKKKECDKSENVQVGLKSQVESLREELKATQKAYMDKMNMSLGKLENEWQEKMRGVEENHQVVLKSIQDENEALTLQSTSELTRKLNEDFRQAMMMKDTEFATLVESTRGTETAMTRLQGILVAEQQDRVQETSQLRSHQSEEILQLNSLHASAMDTLKTELLDASTQREKKLKEESDSVVHANENIAAAELSKLRNKLNTETARLESEIETTRNNTIAAMETRFVVEKKAISDKLEGKHVSAMTAMRAASDAALERVTETLRKTETEMHQARERVLVVERDLVQAERLHQEREACFLTEQDKLHHENNLAIQQHLTTHTFALREQDNRHRQEVLSLQQAYHFEEDTWRDTLTKHRREYLLLEEKWALRESREEDITRISVLESELKEREDSLDKARDEMMYFKREMLHREETYNEKFGRSPVVGVMNVLKNKDLASSSSSSSQSLHMSSSSSKIPSSSTTATHSHTSNKPSYALPVPPKGGGVGMGVGGMGIGLGIGNSQNSSGGGGGGVASTSTRKSR